ncbi:Hsp33 family molecular chaperone HslO [Kangiella sediminilitoris]|uniref:33 kDa chaperonin n=1 Tax=Kangiella sediminilitoris TaxID=1144748 RepID=A0A1B3B8D8_9GAMM|nr:Hsp33 family molecular chaperone HslO [Kangiella sediminilitoris]AOE49016.1 33 kDa chaperonin [Kangiella sediminilitoris]
MSDTIQRFTFAKLPIRGEVITLEQSYQTIVEQHQYPKAERQLLGQALAANALMAEIIKIKGKIALQLQSPSTVKLLLTECDHQGHIRGLMHTNESNDGSELNFPNWTQNGQMAITIEPEEGQRYQGVVPLENQNLAECLEDYFARSEQLPTSIQLYVNDNKVTGLFLQALPANSQQDISPEDKAGAFEHVKTLAETLEANEALNLSHQEILYRLFHQDEVTLYPEKSIEFQCSCSRQRNERALSTIEPSELVNMVKESGGQLELICDFCSSKEVFSEDDIMTLLSSNAPSDSVN